MAKKVIKRKNRYYVKNNQETAKGAFYKKKLYRNEMSRQKQHVVNFTYAEKFLYGRVDTTLQKVFKDLSTHKVLIAGSEGFVDNMYNYTISLKAKKENIFFEKFSKF